MLIKNLFRHWTFQVFLPGTVLREKYEAFKLLLEHDKVAHEVMAELEEVYYNQKKVDFQAVVSKYSQLAVSVSGMVAELSKMCPSRYIKLKAYFKKFDFYIRFMLAPPRVDCSPPFTIKFDKISKEKEALVGGKALLLSVLSKELSMPIPEGFIITTSAFHYLMASNDLSRQINSKLAGLDINNTLSLEHTAAELDALILDAKIPEEIERAILNALKSSRLADCNLAMRSSAVKEDGPASFAGQYKTLLNLRKRNVFNAYKKIIASKYCSKALYYRIRHGILDWETPMAVIVSEMIDSEASGIIYTQDAQNKAGNSLVIHSTLGQGSLLVDGKVSPDIIWVSKKDPHDIVRVRTGLKQKKMILAPEGTTRVVLNKDEKQRLSIDPASVLILARWGGAIEKYFQTPQDIEWCLDKSRQLLILQSRPLELEKIETKPQKSINTDIKNTVLISEGVPACSGVGTGAVHKIEQPSDLNTIPKGAVLVAKTASSQYVTVLDRIKAIVTDTGAYASHFSSVAREFNVPALVNTGNAFEKLVDESIVTVDAGNQVVYAGAVAALAETSGKKRDLLQESSFMLKLRYVINFVSKLKLVDPQSGLFVPEECRSLHDIIRFSHEKAVKEMFGIGSRKGGRRKGAKKLISNIPMLFYILDVGDGTKNDNLSSREIRVEDIVSTPMRAVLKGLSNPGIPWSRFSHFDWEEYDKIVMAGGIISADAAQFGSYAVLSKDYLNINLRFGYHFVILDTICSDVGDDNYILFRFSGGGGSRVGKSLRANFIKEILTRLGFMVEIKSDLVDAEYKHGPLKTMQGTLDIIGRLLGATRLMDMYLKEGLDLENLVEDFMQERYDFSNLQR
jgi:pyruvate,water dikinase